MDYLRNRLIQFVFFYVCYFCSCLKAERLKAYKFRIYPTEEQEIFFAKSFGCVRKVYHLILDDRMKAYEETKYDSSKK